MEEKFAKFMMILIFSLAVTGLYFINSYGQLSPQTIASALEDDENKGCEYFVVSEGMHLPVRLEITYPSTPNVDPPTKALLDAESTFQSSFNNIAYSFSTESLDNFQIRFQLDYDAVREDQSRNAFYEFIIGNETQTRNLSGNWLIEGTHLCKIIDFWTSREPNILTKQEIADSFNEVTTGQFDQILGYQVATSDIIVILVAVSVITFLVYMAIMIKLYKRSDDAQNTIDGVVEILEKKVGQFDEVIASFRRFVSFNDIRLKNAIEDFMILKNMNKPSDVEIKTTLEHDKSLPEKLVDKVKNIVVKKQEEPIVFPEQLEKLTYKEACDVFEDYRLREKDLSSQERVEFRLLYEKLQKGESAWQQ